MTPGQRGWLAPTAPPPGTPTYRTTGFTDAFAKASVVLQVTKQPGDNFRVGASHWNGELDKLTDNTVTPDNAQVAGWTGRLTDMLTVWRRLWVERDTMAAGAAGTYAVTIQAVTPGTGTAGDTVTFTGAADLEGGVDEYEGGTLTIPSMSLTLRVYKSTDNYAANDSVRVPGGSFTAAQVTTITAGGVTGTLTDDDAFTLPHLPSGGNLIHSAFGNAYIKPIYVDSGLNTRTTVPFRRYLNDDRGYMSAIADLAPPPGTPADPIFWTTQLAGVWENKANTDADPDGYAVPVLGAPGVEAGKIDYGYAGPEATDLNCAVIFLEAIDDVVRNAGLASATTDEEHTVVHELGHTAGIDGHGEVDPQTGDTTNWTGIMRAKAPRSSTYFDNIHLAHLRGVSTW